MAPPRDRRPGFSRRAQYGVFFGYILAIAGGVVGAVLLALSLLNPSTFAPVRAGMAEVTAPVSSALAVAVDTVSGVPGAIASWWNVHGKNAELTAQVARARPALVAGHLAQLENARLRRLLAVRDLQPAVIVTARIVSSSASSTRRFGLLNAGAWQGVREGQPVQGPEGLVGRVLETGPNTARVLLLTDPQSIVPVRRLRDGLPALAAGRGDGLIDIRVIDTDDAHFKSGDIFVTSGSGGIFAPGVLVARVLQPGPETAPAKPFARPDATDLVSVRAIYTPPPLPEPAARPGTAPSPQASPTADAALAATPTRR
ncbi:rod shape-determining protein MreC [Sphingomonas sp. HHU CXW]|uniref:Cell shape-determining protein MreC n=1 Tax=Sphingomonas hominis TaxID=2741495 RepID=A0ABX2JGH6_9SPHN|nr:rod shape-determining protein MreC [Sphingomonas hominis]NTS65705.1 rod shape-determining protein MreC [Sphingomonas hominis]